MSKVILKSSDWLILADRVNAVVEWLRNSLHPPLVSEYLRNIYGYVSNGEISITITDGDTNTYFLFAKMTVEQPGEWTIEYHGDDNTVWLCESMNRLSELFDVRINMILVSHNRYPMLQQNISDKTGCIGCVGLAIPILGVFFFLVSSLLKGSRR